MFMCDLEQARFERSAVLTFTPMQPMEHGCAGDASLSGGVIDVARPWVWRAASPLCAWPTSDKETAHMVDAPTPEANELPEQ